MIYYSEHKRDQQPRSAEEITEIVWEGIRGLIHARVNDGSFGVEYPEICQDGSAIIGTNVNILWGSMRANIPRLRECPWNNTTNQPSTLDVLDMVEFCWKSVSNPKYIEFHNYFKHYHLSFDRDGGQSKFCEDINDIFRRNHLVYELTPTGEIKRLAPPVLGEALASSSFASGDLELDRLLNVACSKILDPHRSNQYEALRHLWDAWERLKTLDEGSDKKTQTTSLLDFAAGSTSSEFRNVLETDGKKLTDAGNQFHIRHSETSQENLSRTEHIEYLFYRLFGLIWLILRTKDQAI